LCRNGEYKWLSWNLISVSDEELIYGVVRDITEEQAAEDALRESEHRLAALINFQPDATFAISTDHKVIAWNREMERLTGTTADAMLGQGIDKYSPIFYGEARPLLANLALEYNESLTKEYESIQREGETLVAEVYVPRLTPEGVHLWLKARPLRDIRGKLIGAIESLRDVSQSKKAQLALQENEALLRSILVAAPVGIGIVKNRIITWSNQRLQDMLGYSECELQNQSARILYESDAEFRRIADVKHPQVEKLGVGTVETVFLAKDGRKLNIILSSAAITPGYLEQGLVFTVLDVTTSKRAADALREQQATVNAIVETSQDWIWEIELDGKHTYTNPAVREILGYRPEEIIGTSGNDIMHEEDREKALSVLAECGKTLKGWSNLLLRWRHKDGSYRYLESSGVPILNPQGELTGFRGVDRDITERIHSQEALRESEEKFRKLYTKTPAMLHSIDRDGRLVSVSDTWLEKMGYAAEEVIGRKSTEFLTETSREYAKSQVLPRFFETGICTDINYQFVTKTGAVLDVLLSATSERDAAGNVDRSLAIITDITDRKRAEEALNSTLADLNTTLNATADGILAISDQRKVSFLNKRFAELWKIPEAVLASDDDFTLLQFVVNQLSDPNEFIRRIDSLYISSESSFDTLNFKDGRVFERFSFAILGEDGRVSGRVWSFRDVTERKYAEEALRESEEKYRFLVENSQEAILIVQDGLFKFVNPLLCEKVGRTPEELIDKPFIGYVYQDDREFVMSRYLQRMEGENVPISYDFRINSPDGGYFWIHILIAEMMWEGRPATFLTMSDITERKHAEEALRDSEEKYRGLYLAVTGGVLVTDSHGLITHANEAACEILQLPLDGIVGRVMEPSQDWAALDSQGNPMPADDYPPLRAISTREPVRGATMGFTLGDSCEPRWVLVNSEPVLDPVSEEVVSSVTTFVDITRQKLMEEELERASKSLSEKVMELEQFIYTVSHDLRTPLVTMQGFVEVIRKDIDKEAPDSIQDALGRIYRSTQRMDGLLKDLLEMSRIGRVTRKPELVDLCDTMSEILAEVIPADRGYQVDMGHCHCSEPVLYDPVRLHQVLANLLENAVKFTRSTPNPTIRLMCEERGDEVEITIGDNGIGISPQYHDKVFEVFTRLPGAADAPGSGVGLAIVKRIVELHGGRIWVVSDEGKGAEFHFTIKKGGFDDGTQ
jgi:PAS domain S-box-containing protein